MVSGSLTNKTKIKMMETGDIYDVVSLGYHTPFEKEVDSLLPGEVGFITASILWSNKFLRKVFDPYLTILNSLPKVALGL